MSKPLARLRPLFVRRVVSILAAACVATSLIVTLVRLNPNPRLPDFTLSSLPLINGGHSDIGRCDLNNRTDAPERWRAASERYSNLTEDRFTIAIQTYKQAQELDDVLQALLADKIPSLHEIVVVWNNVGEDPPGNFISEHGVSVRYRPSAVNSRNQKFLPDEDFKTQAILLSDSDVYYQADDLEFVFQTWRSLGHSRLTGALPRCVSQTEGGRWEYHFCSRDADQDVYAMIVTNLCFSHISLLDFYSSDDAIMAKVRKYVDDHAGCEDVAMNYMVSYLTGHGQLLVEGRDKYVSLDEPREGWNATAKTRKYLDGKSKCLNDMNEMFGCMPLVNETGHMGRGIVLP